MEGEHQPEQLVSFGGLVYYELRLCAEQLHCQLLGLRTDDLLSFKSRVIAKDGSMPFSRSDNVAGLPCCLYITSIHIESQMLVISVGFC